MTKSRASTREMVARLALLERGLKFCKNCQKILSVDKFGKDPRHSDGLQTFCKECCNLLRRTKWGEKIRAYGREYHVRNKEKANARKREYMRQRSDYFHAKNKKWKRGNRERMLKRGRERHQEHREEDNAKARVRMKEWVAKNKARHSENCRRHEMRLKQAGGSHTLGQWLKLLELCGNVCLACSAHEGITHDHIIPIRWGGSDNIDNIQPLCLSCNCTKQDLYAVDYRPSLARAWASVESVAWVGDGL